MLSKQYSGVQFKLVISFKNDKELPLGELMQLEADIATAVHSLAQAEKIALKIMEGKTIGKADF